jgi:FkbM family methyltransferase
VGRFDRAAGLARSLAIYHGIPRRQRRLRDHYRQFVKPGDLVFDVGAHAGNRVRAFAALGCHVVAVEPQPDFARLLRLLFGRRTGVDVVEQAVGASAGRMRLSISERTPTVTTAAESWRDARSGEPDFVGVRWNASLDVESTTLDQLIGRYGTPAFIKIDVEGAELSVLSGLSRAIEALSFEYLPRALEDVGRCAARLLSLGDYRFNWSLGESYEMTASTWLTAADLMESLHTPEPRRRSGDVYARLVG